MHVKVLKARAQNFVAWIELLEYLTGLNLNGSFWVCQFQSSVKCFFNSQFDSLLLGFGIFSILAILFFTL